MLPLIPLAAAVLCLLLAEGGGASATTRLDVSPKHGHRSTTFTVSFRAGYAVSEATKTQYVIGAVNSGDCRRGVSSFGHVATGPYKLRQTVRFVLRAPRSGWCVGVFHGVGHFERKVGDHWADTRIGRFAFRVLPG
jgi:hypothetical protein